MFTHSVKYLTYVNSLNPHNSSMCLVPLLPTFYTFNNGATGRINNLHWNNVAKNREPGNHIPQPGSCIFAPNTNSLYFFSAKRKLAGFGGKSPNFEKWSDCHLKNSTYLKNAEGSMPSWGSSLQCGSCCFLLSWTLPLLTWYVFSWVLGLNQNTVGIWFII